MSLGRTHTRQNCCEEWNQTKIERTIFLYHEGKRSVLHRPGWGSSGFRMDIWGAGLRPLTHRMGQSASLRLPAFGGPLTSTSRTPLRGTGGSHGRFESRKRHSLRILAAVANQHTHEEWSSWRTNHIPDVLLRKGRRHRNTGLTTTHTITSDPGLQVEAARGWCRLWALPRSISEVLWPVYQEGGDGDSAAEYGYVASHSPYTIDTPTSARRTERSQQTPLAAASRGLRVASRSTQRCSDTPAGAPMSLRTGSNASPDDTIGRLKSKLLSSTGILGQISEDTRSLLGYRIQCTDSSD